MRKRFGARFWWVSLFTVFAVQGVLMWVVSLPVQLGQAPDDPGLGVLAAIGVVVWATGLFFEVVGDTQLAPSRPIHEPGHGHGPRSVAIHPPSQLLR